MESLPWVLVWQRRSSNVNEKAVFGLSVEAGKRRARKSWTWGWSEVVSVLHPQKITLILWKPLLVIIVISSRLAGASHGSPWWPRWTSSWRLQSASFVQNFPVHFWSNALVLSVNSNIYIYITHLNTMEGIPFVPGFAAATAEYGDIWAVGASEACHAFVGQYRATASLARIVVLMFLRTKAFMPE